MPRAVLGHRADFPTTATGDQILFAYDPLNRLETTTVKDGDNTLFTTEYGYKNKSGNRTTNQVDKRDVYFGEKSSTGSNTILYGEQFYYDSMGNITSVYGGNMASGSSTRLQLEAYYYDTQNQLTQEVMCIPNTAGTANLYNYTYSYTYDTAGNIQTITETNGNPNNSSTTTKTLSYDNSTWRDLLTAVNGSPIVYEGQTLSGTTVSGTALSGNPIRYTNGSKTYTNLTWQHGRQLASLTTNGKTYTYDYDADGIRTKKAKTSETHDYITQGGKVVREIVKSPDWDWVLDFIYDNSGRPFALKYSTDGGETFDTYYYILNYQGDVVKLVEADGTVVATYRYNAWGELYSSSGSMASINPLRYRGYYYDSETGFYYVSSRYYDPEIGRWINADDVAYIGVDGTFLSHNLFAYCGNNPVMGYDPTGHWDWGGVLAGLGIIAATVITVATLGVASPLGAVVAGAAITTGATMTYAAATDSTMVIDLSYSTQLTQNTYAKGGGSLVIDFKNDTANFYTHGGGGRGHSSGFSYSVGLVDNYDHPDDYAKHFLDVNGGAYIGVDHCWNPLEDHSTSTQATSITFSKGTSYGVGYDYYSKPTQVFAW